MVQIHKFPNAFRTERPDGDVGMREIVSMQMKHSALLSEASSFDFSLLLLLRAAVLSLGVLELLLASSSPFFSCSPPRAQPAMGGMDAGSSSMGAMGKTLASLPSLLLTHAPSRDML